MEEKLFREMLERQERHFRSLQLSKLQEQEEEKQKQEEQKEEEELNNEQ
jgi:hypothetical protein